MDLEFNEADQAFRDEVRTFLKNKLPSALPRR